MSGREKVRKDGTDSHAPVQTHTHRLARHNFFRAAALGLAVVTGGTALMLPKDARAQVVQVEGVKVQTQRLTDKLENLVKKAPAQNGGIRDNNDYSSSVLFLHEMNAIFYMQPTSNGWGNSGIVIAFQKPDEPTTSGMNGRWGNNYPGFVPLVKKLTGKEVKGLFLVTERTSIDGEPAINAFALPTDAQGNIIGQYKGGNLALGLSFFPQDGNAGGGVALLLDPGAPQPNFEVAKNGNKVALK